MLLLLFSSNRSAWNLLYLFNDMWDVLIIKFLYCVVHHANIYSCTTCLEYYQSFLKPKKTKQNQKRLHVCVLFHISLCLQIAIQADPVSQFDTAGCQIWCKPFTEMKVNTVCQTHIMTMNVNVMTIWLLEIMHLVVPNPLENNEGTIIRAGAIIRVKTVHIWHTAKLVFFLHMHEKAACTSQTYLYCFSLVTIFSTYPGSVTFPQANNSLCKIMPISSDSTTTGYNSSPSESDSA